jgi:hypothetical protein
MIIILGLVILVAALVVGVAGVLGNGGSAHAVGDFSVLGYHLTGSAGTLFLSGFVVGGAGLLGLSLLLAGARRTSRRGSAARRQLRQSRRETAAASQERDDLIDQRDTAGAAGQPASSTDRPEAPLRPDAGHRRRLRDPRNRPAPRQAGTQPDPPAPDALASSSEPDLAAISPSADVPADAPDPDLAVISPTRGTHASVPGPAE